MKRTEIKRRPLTEATIRNLEPEPKAYQERDSDSLYLRVMPSGSKSWMFRYKKADGKGSWKGVGGYPTVTGKEARATAREWAQRMRLGEGLPGSAADKAHTITVAKAADQFIEFKSQSLTQASITSYNSIFSNHIIPLIGDTALASISRLDCTHVMEAIRLKGFPVVSEHSRKYLDQLFGWAIAYGYCEHNPASELKRVTQRHTSTEHPFLTDPQEIGEFMRCVSRSPIRELYREAVYIILYTVVRKQNIQLMHWDEINLDKALWVIPAHKMKTNVEFTTPLVSQVVKILSQRPFKTGYVFPTTKRVPKKDGTYTETMSSVTLAKQFIAMGYKGKLVPHGCRHMASTILNEQGWDSRLIESQLAHKLPGVAGIYNKAEYIEKRRKMMQWYADHLESLM